MRLLAAELGEHGIRVNGVNPDGVVRGSGIFAGGWGAQRAAVYGVAEEELGAFYAQRTLLKREVLPEHVADAVFALTGGDLSQTTGCTSRSTPASRRRSCAEPATAFAAVDLGASSGPGDAGRVSPRRVELREVHRFANRPVRVRGTLHWDVLALWAGVLDGLRPPRAAATRSPASASTPGRSTTACSTRTAGCSATRCTTATRAPTGWPTQVADRRRAEELYARTGVQLLPFNTVFQLVAAARDRGRCARGARRC